MDFFCGWDGYYRPMEWTPVELSIASDVKEPFAGSFTMTARQDGINTLNVVHTFVLTPDHPLSAPLVTKFAFATDRCALAIRDDKGRTRWRQTINMWDFSTQNRVLRVVQDQDLLLGLVGQASFGLLRLPRRRRAHVGLAGSGQGLRGVQSAALDAVGLDGLREPGPAGDLRSGLVALAAAAGEGDL